jgi:hypothetical protein
MDLTKSQVVDPAFKLGMLRVDIVVRADVGLDLVNIHSSNGGIATQSRLQLRCLNTARYMSLPRRAMLIPEASCRLVASYHLLCFVAESTD